MKIHTSFIKINMKKIIISAAFLPLSLFVSAQMSPVISSWLQNTTGIKGRHYVTGNSTPINDNDSANVQTVLYSTSWVYVRTKGIPAYISGPYGDMNPSNATSQNAMFKLTRTPVKNATPTSTTGGNIGLFINGVALFDYRDGVSWSNSSNTVCGGPIRTCTGDGVWNRDAVVGERLGFDCSKAHPAMGNYHHHQNPSAFNLDLNVISTVCNLYLSDGLYAIDSTRHSPLIGFAYDGFPIYGAYGYKNINGSGGIVRMKSSYTKRAITTRTTYSSGVTVTAGPAVSATYPLGYFREDYQYNTTSAATPDYLDEHNGRFCVTPEYPAGIYCYFATVDANWNSAYPYIVGPTFYGVKNTVKVTSITEPVTVYSLNPLPINLLSFNGHFAVNKNVLQWATTSEVNNSHFDVEKSTDGINFQKIVTIQGAGNSSGQRNYSYEDNLPSSNINYYRLKQFDADGNFKFSNIITISNSKGCGIKVFPNPTSDLIVVQIDDILKHDIQVSMSNLQGQVVLKKDFYQGTTICFLETTTIYDGTYVLTVNDNGEKKSYKVVINR